MRVSKRWTMVLSISCLPLHCLREMSLLFPNSVGNSNRLHAENWKGTEHLHRYAHAGKTKCSSALSRIQRNSEIALIWRVTEIERIRPHYFLLVITHAALFLAQRNFDEFTDWAWHFVLFEKTHWCNTQTRLQKINRKQTRLKNAIPTTHTVIDIGPRTD